MAGAANDRDARAFSTGTLRGPLTCIYPLVYNLLIRQKVGGTYTPTPLLAAFRDHGWRHNMAIPVLRLMRSVHTGCQP